MELLPKILPSLLSGALTTVLLSLAAATGALVVGFATGFMRLSPFALLRVPATIYLEIFRNTSSLIQVYYFFYVLPFAGVYLEPFTTAVLVLSLNFGANICEVVRSSVLAIDRGQHQAAIALNMTAFGRYRRIILPQAVSIMLPAFGNYALEMVKTTSLVSVITITELTFSGAQLVQTFGHPTLVYSLILAMYFIMAIPIIFWNRRMERRYARR